jgi:hypothetical protein
LFTILRELKLQVAPHKTRMGFLKRGFHFLGIFFEVARTPAKQIQTVAVDIHSRTCRRALDRVVVMQQDAVNPAKIQRYLSRWAIWWNSMIGLEKIALLYRWVSFTATLKGELAWLGRGLLLGSVYYCLCLRLPDNSNQNHLAVL